MRAFPWLLAALAVLVASGARSAPEPEKVVGPGALWAREFVLQAAMGGVAEIRFGQLAIEKAAHMDVKRFGRRMVEDHGKANTELAGLGKEKGFTMPADMDAEHKVTAAKLAALSGAPFDKAYMAEMVTDHEKDIAAFEKQTAEGRDPVIRAWASRTLPTLRRHLKLARETASRVGAPTSASR